MIFSRRGWLLYALSWAAFSLLYSQAPAMKPGMSLGTSLLLSAADLAPAAMLGVAVWVFSGRVSLSRWSVPGLLLIHLAGSVTFSVAWLLVSLVRRVLSGGVSDAVAAWHRVPSVVARAVVGWHFVDGIVIYFVIAGVS